jgi:O-antigen ligase
MNPMRAPTPSSWPPAWRDAITRLARLAAIVLIVASIAALAAIDVSRYVRRTRGVESGLAADQPPLMTPRVGVNVALEQYGDEVALDRALDAARAAGLGVVRQYARWADLEPTPGDYRWDLWDRIMPALARHHLQVIVVLDTSPAWARPSWEQDNPYAPPADMADLARFAAAFAERYAGQVLAYQVWDEPNVAPHWGSGAVDPQGYVDMLRTVAVALRAADPNALIIGGGLAPNTEPGGRNMSDVLYLHELYRRGAGASFDVLGVKAYGFWSGPDDRRVSAKVLNFSRTILLRREMLRRGEAAKPVWALESGWNALPADWAGPLPAQGSDTPLVQATRLTRAIARMRREWPWMTLMVTQHLQPAAPPEDPVWGFALLDAASEPTLLLEQLTESLRDDVLYPGLTPITSSNPLTPTPEGSRFRFWGTDLLLWAEQGVASEVLTVSVDALVNDTHVDLQSAAPGVVRRPIGRTMPVDTHLARLQGESALGAVRALQIGHRPALAGPWASLVIGLAVLAWGARSAWREARTLPWRGAWSAVAGRWRRAPEALQRGVVASGLAVVIVAPSQGGRLAGLALYVAGAVLRPDLALMAVVACVPLAPYHVRLGPGTFAMFEVSLLVAAAAHAWAALMTWTPSWRAVRRWIVARPMADWAVVALVLLGLVAAVPSEYPREALREWRVVFFEAAVFYALLRGAFFRPRQALQLVDVLLLAGAGVALYALARYPLAEGVIEAEGVRRARAFFGSPNNLALVLERLLPLGIAMAWHGATRWRRLLYGVGAIPMAVALVLTFSRGAVLLALPASLLYLGWTTRSRAVRLVAVGLVIGVLAIVPFAGVERLTSLLDPTQGTTFLRLALWQAAWDMVRDHPWLGVGPDNFLYYYGDYIRPGAEVDRWLSHPHNVILDFWLRLGVGGLAVAGAMAVGLAQGARRALGCDAAGGKDAYAVTLGLVAGAIASLAHGLTDNAFFLPELSAWWMVALAWCVTRGQHAAAQAPQPIAPVHPER